MDEIVDQMNIRQEIRERTCDEEVLFLGSSAGEFDDAIIGLCERNGCSVVVYNTDMVLALLRENGLSREEAEEHFDFNIAGAHMGEYTPMYVRPIQKGCTTCGQSNSAFFCSNGYHNLFR